jgi:hypothetical protein
MISFITLIPYSIAAVPLQVILNKWPKKFNILYLFIYCVDPIRDYRKMFTFAVGAAVIYWLWDSIIMNKDKYPYY